MDPRTPHEIEIAAILSRIRHLWRALRQIGNGRRHDPAYADLVARIRVEADRLRQVLKETP